MPRVLRASVVQRARQLLLTHVTSLGVVLWDHERLLQETDAFNGVGCGVRVDRVLQSTSGTAMATALFSAAALVASQEAERNQYQALAIEYGTRLCVLVRCQQECAVAVAAAVAAAAAHRGATGDVGAGAGRARRAPPTTDTAAPPADLVLSAAVSLHVLARFYRADTGHLYQCLFDAADTLLPATSGALRDLSTTGKFVWGIAQSGAVARAQIPRCTNPMQALAALALAQPTEQLVKAALGLERVTDANVAAQVVVVSVSQPVLWGMVVGRVLFAPAGDMAVGELSTDTVQSRLGLHGPGSPHFMAWPESVVRMRQFVTAARGLENAGQQDADGASAAAAGVHPPLHAAPPGDEAAGTGVTDVVCVHGGVCMVEHLRMLAQLAYERQRGHRHTVLFARKLLDPRVRYLQATRRCCVFAPVIVMMLVQCVQALYKPKPATGELRSGTESCVQQSAAASAASAVPAAQTVAVWRLFWETCEGVPQYRRWRALASERLGLPNMEAAVERVRRQMCDSGAGGARPACRKRVRFDEAGVPREEPGTWTPAPSTSRPFLVYEGMPSQ